ncbi:hypothetical protein CK516_20370 [Nostoc sp. 'Peltigera malacea cyanobiont' DB3992]|nr:hypothetical protein CK516_20370 [Nostoc sp. 'Peltigera malacea cyanobiont' DB3992]
MVIVGIGYPFSARRYANGFSTRRYANAQGKLGIGHWAQKPGVQMGREAEGKNLLLLGNRA